MLRSSWSRSIWIRPHSGGMANNRLFIECTQTGDRVMLAKGYGAWEARDSYEPAVQDFLRQHDGAGAQGERTTLRLVDEWPLDDEVAVPSDGPSPDQPKWTRERADVLIMMARLLRWARLYAGTTMPMLSTMSGVDVMQLIRMERGDVACTVDELRAVVQALLLKAPREAGQHDQATPTDHQDEVADAPTPGDPQHN